MQIIRTILWLALLIGILAFTFGNWDKDAEVRIWFGLVWDTKIPAIVIVSFLIGLVPMWLYHRGSKWRLQRRVSNLETANRTTATATTVDTKPSPELRPNEPVSPFGAEKTRTP